MQGRASRREIGVLRVRGWQCPARRRQLDELPQAVASLKERRRDRSLKTNIPWGMLLEASTLPEIHLMDPVRVLKIRRSEVAVVTGLLALIDPQAAAAEPCNPVAVCAPLASCEST